MNTQLRIDGPIDAQTAQHVRDALASAPGAVDVFLNSPGGEVSEGIAIYNALRAHQAGVTVIVDGFALSVASAIACAGRPTRAMANSTWMLHGPRTSSTGNANAMRQSADALEKVAESLIGIYAKRTGKTADELRALLTGEVWMTGAEAVAFGLADEVVEGRDDEAPDEATAAMAAYAATHYRHTPTRIHAMTTAPNTAAILAAETARRSEIRTVFGSHADAHRVILDACLDDPKVTADAASRKLLAALAENSTPTTGLRWSETDRVPDFMAAATDALLMRAGIPVDKPHAGAKDLRRMSLQAMAESCVSLRGGTIRDRSPAGVFRASHSTSDFPLLLANTANKALMSGYEAEPASHTLKSARDRGGKLQDPFPRTA
ncbi:MAG: Clp protease ClpP [Rhodanobacteraceae bacterium]|nr:Clp protease ClpP [Rhodanobacteraceae bacterium]